MSLDRGFRRSSISTGGTRDPAMNAIIRSNSSAISGTAVRYARVTWKLVGKTHSMGMLKSRKLIFASRSKKSIGSSRLKITCAPSIT